MQVSIRSGLYAVVVLVLLGLASRHVTAQQPPLRIVVIGDSTVASYLKPPADRPDLTGWGQVLGESFGPQVEVVNHAKSGRSSKSFQSEGLWQKSLAARPNYVFIQFGHNDCPGKGERSTDPQTDFRDYLRKYIDDARRIGAEPVLVTPMTRRVFIDGKIRTTLRPYAEAMLAVGTEQQVPVIDLHAASVDLFNSLGDEASADLSASLTDRTHFSRKGAKAMAKLIVDRLPDAVPQLKPHLCEPSAAGT